jgi:hypothetical protein
MLRKIVHSYRPCVVGHIPSDKHSFAVSCSLCVFFSSRIRASFVFNHVRYIGQQIGVGIVSKILDSR